MFTVNKRETFHPAHGQGYESSRLSLILCLLITALFCLTAATNTASAATYYVDDANGIDTNPGTSAQPWKTLNRAYTRYSGADPKVQEGDTVYLKNGSYGEFREHTNDSPVNAAYVERTSWITYVAATGHTPTLSNVVINNRDHDNNFRPGQSYLVIDGFSITDGVLLQDTEYVKILNCEIQREPVAACSEGYYAPYFVTGSTNIKCNSTHGVSNLTVEDCNIHSGYKGILLDGNDVTIKNNVIHHFSEDGIAIQSGPSGDTDNVLLEGNIFYDCRPYTSTMEIWGANDGTFNLGEVVTIPGTDATGIVGTLYNGTYIRLYATSQNTFYQYYDPQAGEMLDPAYYILGADSGAKITDITKVDPPHTDLVSRDDTSKAITNLVIRGNIIDKLRDTHENTENIQGLKLFGGDESISVTIENNIVTGANNTLMRGLKDAIINNNTFIGDASSGMLIRSEYDSTISEMYNNIMEKFFMSSGNGTISVAAHGNNIFKTVHAVVAPFEINGTETVLVSDANFAALFVDLSAEPNNVELAADSLAIDYANPNYGPSSDILGVSRVFPPDAGCYEYVSSDPNSQIYSITASAGTEGQISPGGTIQVNSGGTQTYTMTPNAGYQISDVLVDGSSVGAVDSYIFENVTANHTIAAIFTYTITASAIGGGTISPSGITQVVPGGSQAYSITVNSGYHISDVLVDGSSVGAVTSYSFTNVTANHTIAATFAINTYTITASAIGGGTISPSGTTQVNWSGTQSYTITLNAGYHISDVLVDGSSVGVVTSYSFTNVTANHTIAATFAINTYTITASAGSGGTISPSGTTQVNWSGTQSYTITLNAGYHISDVLVDGSSVGVVTSYSFTNVTANHTIAATFAEQDVTKPIVTNLSPQTDSIQAPLNTLVILDITDSGDGVDANSVTVKVNNNIVYTGNTNHYPSADGDCRRLGTKADYRFIYHQWKQNFDFDQPINVTVNATDLAGNIMDEYSYSFKSEMRSFGENKILHSGSNNENWGPLTTVADSSGNIWVAWPQGVVGSRDIYVGKLVAGTDSFVSSGVVPVTIDIPDQGNPVIAVDSSDKLYLAWQDNRRGNWDIYVSTSNDWSAEIRVTDSNDNQTKPAIVIDSNSPNNNAYIVWEDDRHGNQDIYVAKSSDGFATKMVSQITSDDSNQVEPAIAADWENTIYVVWTDTRNGGKNDIYGAASNSGLWTNIPIVTEEESQSNPAIATEAQGSVLHFVWLDDTPGDDDIYYASTSDGLPSSPLTGRSIIDDPCEKDQLSPVIITTGYTGNDLRVFACWRDERWADADLFFDELSSGDVNNVFVGDDDTSTDQSEPAIGIDGYGQPYIVWINERTDICYAGSTFIEPVVLASSTASVSSKTTVGTVPGSITNIDDVSTEVPQGAYLCDVKVTISRIRNPHKPPSNNRTFLYEFGPSGTTFSESEPVTITIPYNATTLVSSPSAYWYNPLTGLYSQEGITDVEVIQISSGLYALRFKTTHFSIFGGGGPFGGGGGGGGCSMSPNSQGSIVEFLLPYIGLMVVMTILKLRDRRKNKMHDIAKS